MHSFKNTDLSPLHAYYIVCVTIDTNAHLYTHKEGEPVLFTLYFISQSSETIRGVNLGGGACNNNYHVPSR